MPSIIVDHGMEQLFESGGVPYTWVRDHERRSLYLCWRDEDVAHSFVIQGATNWQASSNSHFVVDCLLSATAPQHGEEKSEVQCFLNYHPDHSIQIAGGKASSFYFDAPLFIASPSLQIAMQWTLVEGEGTFFGHLLRGNRPYQRSAPFTASDWQINLRTVARKGACLLRLTLIVGNRHLA